MGDGGSSDHDESVAALLSRAVASAGITAQSIDVLRRGSNVLVGISDDIVARIGPPLSADAARQQLAVARWMHDAGLPVVVPVDLPQPIVVSGRPVTWWRRIPPHRHATPAELGSMLRQLHALPVPEDPELAPLDPFSGLESVDGRDVLTKDERAWLHAHVATLRDRYAGVRTQLRPCVLHGDAWQGNVVVPHRGGVPVLLDLDRVALGPREWDLVPIAVDHVDFARISDREYGEFVNAVGGTDVTTSPAFPVLAAITEVRWTAFVIRRAASDSRLREEVHHRLRCLRGSEPKPWTWTAT